MELSDTLSFIVQCKFLSGSNAQACLVVLVSDTENTTVILTRDADKVEMYVRVTYSPSRYKKVVAYDIKHDGSVGNLAIPGVLINKIINSNAKVVCSPRDTTNPGLPCKFLCLSSRALAGVEQV